MGKNHLLAIDASINLLLGLIFILVPKQMVILLGADLSGDISTVNLLKATLAIFGGVLAGIGFALLLEFLNRPKGLTGLGLGGAVMINLSGGFILAGWLIFGNLIIPQPMLAILWILFLVLVILSAIELIIHFKKV